MNSRFLRALLVGMCLAGGAWAQAASVVRSQLTDAELAAPIDFEIALKVRDFPELQSRVQRGEIIPYAELEAKYLPTEADYNRVAAWCGSQGLTLTRRDRHHLGVFVRGSVAQAQTALGARFARVRWAGPGGEATGAITPARLPPDLAPAVLSVNGLEPPPPASTAALTTFVSGNSYITPKDVATIYGSAASGLTGAGQTIAVIMDDAPYPDDLTTFWSDCQVAQSNANVTVIPVAGGPPTSGGHLFEASLDVEWASSLAPGAAVRVYAIPSITSLAQIDAALAQVIQDLPSYPGLHQLSISIGLLESAYTLSQLQSSSQYFAVLASQGVSCFAGSGDGGSNPDPTNSVEYDPAAPLGVCYPGSDPNVLAVGGADIVLNSQGALTSETAWGLMSGTTYPDGYGYDATGGGFSVFPRPPWQTNLNLPGSSGTARSTPDVGAPAIGTPYGLVIYNHGQALGIIGTSWSGPIWAAFCALWNQARAANAETPLGLLAPKLYALPTAANFRPITSGTNGAYSASAPAAYNLCTGLGTPNFPALLKSLTLGPTFTTEPANQTVAAGGALTLSAGAAGSGALSYQWQFNGTAIPGATASTYTLASVAANQGGAYTVSVSNAYGTVTSTAAVVTIAVTARLVDLSTRAAVGTGANLLVAGFVISGPSPKQMLLRAVGPTLAQFGLTGVLAQPRLDLYNAQQTDMTTDTAWGGGQTLASAFTRVGAFALPANSADSAVLTTLAPGSYTAEVTGVGATSGIALAEIYDADSGSPSSRLVNLSSRGPVAGSGGILSAGLVISGSSSDTVLIRAIGPALAQFGVSGPVATPLLTLYDSHGNQLAINSGWGGSPALAALFNQVGAFALPTGSADCALLLTLPPGSYTAQVSGLNDSAGIGMVEVYEVP